MRKAFVSAVTTFLILTWVSPVLAQTSPVRPQAQTQQATRPEQATSRRQGAVSAIVDRILSKLQARLELYGRFIGKLEQARARLSDQGKDVAQLDSLIRVAKINFAAARNTLSIAKNNLADLDYTQDVSELRAQIRAEINKVTLALRELHTSVAQAVSEIRSLSQ